MIDYEQRFGGDRHWPGLTNELLPRTEREGQVARAAFLAGQLAVGGWERPDIEACAAFPRDEMEVAAPVTVSDVLTQMSAHLLLLAGRVATLERERNEALAKIESRDMADMDNHLSATEG
jgi:hypothetical protein